MKQNNKGDRNFQTKKRYIKRVKRITRKRETYKTPDGEITHSKTANEKIKSNEHTCLKNSGTPCSCSICRGKKRRDQRAKDKNSFKKEIKEII